MSNINRALADLRLAVQDAYAGTIEEQIDALGACRDAAKLLKGIEGEAKASFDDVAGGTILEGLTHRGSVVEKVDWRLNTKALKKEMGEDWYNKRCFTVTSKSVRLAPID